MQAKLEELKSRLIEINDLRRAGEMLSWDQSTYMPAGGASARARQLASLGRIAQEKFIDPHVGQLLDGLEPYVERMPYDSDDASLVRATRREYERMSKVPPDFMGEFYNHMSECYQAWTQARPQNDFARMAPLLERTLDLSRQLANYFPGYEHIADPLIDFEDSGMRVSTLRDLFNKLRLQLVPLVKAITDQDPIDDSCLRRYYPEVEQLAFYREMTACLGYDFKRGRLDKTHHPFEVSFSIGDARIATRLNENHLGEGLFNTLHEAGHGIYEQGIHPNLEGTLLANGASSGWHESQSRLWENMVGRSRLCWEYFYPRLQSVFPGQLGDTSLETFYRAINKVQPSLIRTDADEVTMNLHVMIRFDLEVALLEGSLAVKDLPQAWNARYESDLGITPPDDRDGVLQDMHWYSWSVGGNFQSYALGDILSAHLFSYALRAHPEILDEFHQGRFSTLHSWLKENVYQHGSKFTAPELIKRLFGESLSIEPYVHYLQTKYADVYMLESQAYPGASKI
jgi:carboxypeptidase Taq